jgi:hypothetical protein
MTERELAIKVRRLLLAAVALIEEYYKLGKHSNETIEQPISEADNTTYQSVVK